MGIHLYGHSLSRKYVWEKMATTMGTDIVKVTDPSNIFLQCFRALKGFVTMEPNDNGDTCGISPFSSNLVSGVVYAFGKNRIALRVNWEFTPYQCLYIRNRAIRYHTETSVKERQYLKDETVKDTNTCQRNANALRCFRQEGVKSRFNRRDIDDYDVVFKEKEGFEIKVVTQLG